MESVLIASVFDELFYYFTWRINVIFTDGWIDNFYIKTNSVNVSMGRLISLVNIPLSFRFLTNFDYLVRNSGVWLHPFCLSILNKPVFSYTHLVCGVKHITGCGTTEIPYGHVWMSGNCERIWRFLFRNTDYSTQVYIIWLANPGYHNLWIDERLVWWQLVVLLLFLVTTIVFKLGFHLKT